jgi:23S rRNA (cytosine1962-C5)-methyltransferase
MEIFGLKGLYEKGPPTSGYHPGKSPEDKPLLGVAAPEAIHVREEGMVLEARLNEGPRTGIYPDQRENRKRLRTRVRGRSVLNTFSYTGAFSVSAALAGAVETVSVDLARRALEWSRRNFALNGIDTAAHRHVKADVFDYLSLARKKGLSFGVIILDPVTFSTSKKGRFLARRDWPRLIGGALEVLEREGWLAVSCNTRSLSEKEIRRCLKEAAREAGRSMVLEEAAGLPPDFPTHPRLPRMGYLKFLLALSAEYGDR